MINATKNDEHSIHTLDHHSRLDSRLDSHLDSRLLGAGAT